MNRHAMIAMILLFDTIYDLNQDAMDPVGQISKLRPLSPKEIEHIQNGAYVILKDNANTIILDDCIFFGVFLPH